MLSARTDRTPSTGTGKKKRGFVWPFGQKARKNTVVSREVEARRKSRLMRGPALLTNGTPQSSTTSPHYSSGNNGERKSINHQEGESNDDARMGAQQQVTNRGNHSDGTDAQSLPSRFRRGLAPAALHAMPYGQSPKAAAVSYKVPMKDGSESDQGMPRINLSRKPHAQSDAPIITKASRARPRGTAWLRNSAYFRQACDSAFESIDVDKSGSVDKKELYSGILLVHLNLGMYLGPAACKPLDRDKCNSIFEKMDVDRSGTLSKEEFRNVMIFLFGNVLLRVIVQWTATVTLVPIIAQYALNWLYYAYGRAYGTISSLDDRFILANWIELSLKATLQFALRCLPGSMLLVMSEINDFIQALPYSVWNAVPLAIVSSILGIAVVPWIIFQIDDFFQWLASRAIRRKV